MKAGSSVKVTYSLPEQLAEQVWDVVGKGRAPSASAFVARVLREALLRERDALLARGIPAGRRRSRPSGRGPESAAGFPRPRLIVSFARSFVRLAQVIGVCPGRSTAGELATRVGGSLLGYPPRLGHGQPAAGDQ